MQPIDAARFFLERRPDIRVRFEVDENSPATGFELRRCGATTMRATR